MVVVVVEEEGGEGCLLFSCEYIEGRARVNEKDDEASIKAPLAPF